MHTHHTWPTDSSLRDVVLTPTENERPCIACDRRRVICDHRYHPVETFAGPVRLVCKLLKCPAPTCSLVGKTFSPEAELAIAPPRLIVDWEVFAWIGHRRFTRHWSVPQPRAELADTHHLLLSDDAIEDYITRYETMLAARQSDPAHFAADYQDIPDLVLSIDGLQPEKGHEPPSRASRDSRRNASTTTRSRSCSIGWAGSRSTTPIPPSQPQGSREVGGATARSRPSRVK